MSGPLLDGLTIAAVADELSAWAGARVQSVVQPDRLSLALELYAPGAGRRNLILSAREGREGISLDEARPRRGTGASTPLTLLAVAQLSGSRLLAVSQPNWERVLHFAFAAPGSPTAAYVLVAELMGRLANLVLVDSDGTVRAVAKPVTTEMTRARTVLPGKRYVPPPAQHRSDPCVSTPESIAAVLTAAGDNGEPAWRAIVRALAGASPLSCREAVFRAAGEAEADSRAVDPIALAGVIRDLFGCEQTAWRPTVAVVDGRVVAYAPYELRHLGGQQADSILVALALFEAASGLGGGYAAAREAVADAIARARLAIERRIAALEREAAAAAESEVLRRKGDLILAHQASIAPRQEVLRAAYVSDEVELEIALDPRLAPAANAQRYFARYKKAKRAGEGLQARRQEGRAALEYLDQLDTDLKMAEDRSGIDEVYASLAAARLDPRPSPEGGRTRPAPSKKSSRGTGPLRVVSQDGFTIWVGRNARQNEDVTFSRAARGDPWLHARDVPGSHVVVKAAGRQVPASTIEEAASMAAWYSRLRDDPSAAVIVADARYVKRQPGARPGMVSVEHGSTVMVRPQAPSGP